MEKKKIVVIGNEDCTKVTPAIEDTIVEEPIDITSTNTTYLNYNVPKYIEFPRKHHNTYKRSHEKIGRNELCACGSGKKFKKCCYYRWKANDMIDIDIQINKGK